jgi:hypothetical protein
MGALELNLLARLIVKRFDSFALLARHRAECRRFQAFGCAGDIIPREVHRPFLREIQVSLDLGR